MTSVVGDTQVTMPITMELVEQDKILYYRVTEPWYFSELSATYPQNQAIRDQYLCRIHTIVNLTDVRLIDPNIYAIRRGTPNLQHPRRDDGGDNYFYVHS